MLGWPPCIFRVLKGHCVQQSFGLQAGLESRLLGRAGGGGGGGGRGGTPGISAFFCVYVAIWLAARGAVYIYYLP